MLRYCKKLYNGYFALKHIENRSKVLQYDNDSAIENSIELPIFM